MQDPNLRAPGTDPALISRLVMHQQIRLQGFNQTQDLQTPQFGMDRCAGERKRPAGADREDVRIPAVGFVRTPHVEHALSAAHGKVPRHEMDQSWTAVSWPKFCEMFYQMLPIRTLKRFCQLQSDDEVYFPTAPPPAVPENGRS